MKTKKIIIFTLIVIMSILALAACGSVPSSDKLESSLKDKGYTVEVAKGDDIKKNIGDINEMGIKLEDIEAILYASKSDESKILDEDYSPEYLFVYYLKSSSAASKLYDKMIEDIDDEDKDTFDYGRSGSAVYLGTKNAVNDMK